MGTWAVDSFGNDDACDWTYELEKVSDLTPVEEALNALLNCDEEGVLSFFEEICYLEWLFVHLLLF